MKAKPKTNAAAIRQQKELSILEQWAANKLRDDNKLTPYERDVLVRHGILKPQPEPEDGAVTIRNATTQAELAVMLARHFQGRFKIDLSEQLLSDWKLGKRLPNGAPLPPAKERAYFIGEKWVAWMEQYILTDQRYRIGGDSSSDLDIHEKAAKAEAQIKLIDEEKKRIELDIVKAKYVLVEKARNTRRGALRLLLSIFLRGLENNDTKTRCEWLTQKLSPQDLVSWREFDVKLAQNRVDAIYDAVAESAKTDPESEQAHQLAEEWR